MESKKIIFLDIDGVIDSYESRSRLDPVLMGRLGVIIEKTGADIVVSSSWRGRTIEETVRMMTDGRRNPFVGDNPFPYPDRIVGITPALGRDRGREIELYLKIHPCEGYVILDDDPDMLPSQMERFVQTDPEKGITDEDVRKAIEILGARP